jgi:hypothetical protein
VKTWMVITAHLMAKSGPAQFLVPKTRFPSLFGSEFENITQIKRMAYSGSR